MTNGRPVGVGKNVSGRPKIAATENLDAAVDGAADGLSRIGGHLWRV
jgi:hypothetical protein